nr:uncharacterized mitochondrial protein AtMg00810-like [Tanacetum cinerariifolium]
NKSDILLVQIYVDDIIFGSTGKEICTEFEKMMHKKLQMSSMGELTFFLRLQVKQKEDGIFISQDKYVNEILNKFGFSNVKTTSTPMEAHKTLLKDEKGEDVDEHLYRSMIGSLMPDIMFEVCACARFQVNPKISHLYAVKRIFRYLKGQPKLGLWYPKDSPFDLVAYTDSDYAGASLDRKSTKGEAEYVATSSCCGQVLWIQNQLLDYGYNFMHTKIHIDNESTICIVKNPVFHSKTNMPYYCQLKVDADMHKLTITTAKAKNINEEAQIHTKVDGKKVVIFKASIRRDLQFGDEGGIDCLPNKTIFKQLSLMGYEKLNFVKVFFCPQWKFLIHTILHCLGAKTTAWNKFSSTMASVVIFLATDQKFNFSKYKFNSMVKNLDSGTKFLMFLRNMKRVGKGFSGKDTYLFPTMIVQAQEELGEDIAIPIETHPTHTITQPSTSKPQKKQKPRKPMRQDTKEIQPSDHIINVADEDLPEDTVPTHFNDSPLLRVNTLGSEEDRIQLKELMELCTKLSDRVPNLETTKTAQAKEIANLKKKVKRLERQRKSRSHGLKRLYKVGLSTRVKSFANEESLGEEDSSKHRRISDIDANQDIYLVSVRIDEDIFGVNDQEDTSMFNADKDLQGEEVVVEEVNVVSITTPVSAAATTTIAATTTVSFDELTLAQALVEIKTLKPKAKEIVMQERNTEKEKLFIEFLEKKIKFFAAKRAKEKRNKPPTKAQQRSLMSTYLKNMDGWKPRALKNKSFAEIKELFDKAMVRINNFVDFRTKLVEDNTKKAQAEIAQESSSKRAGDEPEQEIAKKQTLEDENESAELKRCLEIVPDYRDEVTIDATPLSVKTLIVDYNIYKEGRKRFFQIIRANGNSQMYLTFSKMLKNFDKEDLEVL